MAAPDDAIRALAPVLGVPDGVPEALGGGITNRNYRVRWGGRQCVLRLPGAGTELLGIDRGAEHAAARAAAAAGVGPEVVAFEPRLGSLVTAFLDGAPVEPAALPARIPELAAALRAIHAGPELPTAFDVFEVVVRYREIAAGRGGALPPGLDELDAGARAIRAVLGGPDHAAVPCHNDLLAANLIDDGERLWIVDWEYAGMGDRWFDLANVAVNNGFADADERALLRSYWHDEPTPARLAALGLMRVMSDYREGMWGVVQAAVSELDFDFAGYAAEHLERARAALSDPRVPGWLDDASG